MPCKLTVVAHDGEELFTVGGLWDRIRRQYVEGPCEARRFELKRSQTKIGRAIGKYLAERRVNDLQRVACMMAIGNRGGGKTLVLGGVLMTALALMVTGSYQMGVSITTKQNRELREAIAKVADPRWIFADVDDPRDPQTELITGSRILWMTSKNPAALRQAGLPFEHICVNEGQDQPEKIFVNAISGVRSGGLLSIATNPPQDGDGDWVAILCQGLLAASGSGPADGSVFVLDARLNGAVSQPTLSKIARLLRLVSPQAADADAEGVIKLSGNVGYPGFTKLERVEEGGRWKSGHLSPPHLDWVDVTRQITAEHTESGEGFDFIGGSDFQTDPGSCAAVAKLYRHPSGQLLLHVRELVGTRGTEADLTYALTSHGYFPGPVDWEGRPAFSLLLVGDATGARQNAEHRRRDPYSFTRLRADGWTVLPPDYYGPKRTPWNPLVPDSRKQMKALFLDGSIVLDPACSEGLEGFPSLVDSLLRVKVNSNGRFEKKGHYTHGPDCVRYLAWRFLPRARPPQPEGLDETTFDELASIRVFSGG